MGQKRPIIIHWKSDSRRPTGMGETRRNETEQIKQLLDRLMWKAELEEEDDGVNEDQSAGRDRNGPARNRITDWEHVVAQLSHQTIQMAPLINFGEAAIVRRLCQAPFGSKFQPAP
jgi:hypothetical protein